MARSVAGLAAGSRITDFVSLGVLNQAIPLSRIREVLKQTGKTSRRQRELPAHVVVYYVIALALYMQVSCREVLRCLLEGVQWLLGPAGAAKVTGKSGISQARTRLGAQPMVALYERVVKPIATAQTKGAWYRRWRLVSLDGSTMDVADTGANREFFSRPGTSRGQSAFPQCRFVSLLENGTHILFATQWGDCSEGEITLAKGVLARLQKGMLCLADRNFFGFDLWQRARSGGAQLLWRAKRNSILSPIQRLEDGSYSSKIYPSWKARRHDRGGLLVRAIEYTLEGAPKAEPFYRLLSTILDPKLAPAEELAALYHERWEIETALDELKTHLRGARIVLRSKTPQLVKQEFYGFLLAHFAIRGLMHEAALQAQLDPGRLSFLHAVRVVRRKLPLLISAPPSGPSGASSRYGAGNPPRKSRLQPGPARPSRN